MVYIGNSLSASQCVTDCGSKINFFGSCSEGRMHDARMLDTSGLYVDLAQFAFSPAGQEMCIYGDPYPSAVSLQKWGVNKTNERV